MPVPVRCNSQPINVTTASDAQLKSHFEGLMECLVRVWEPPVTNAGFILVRPTVTIYGRELTTKCGKTGVNAFYCTADQQVYYSNLLPQALPRTVRNNKWTADIVMAHEFGHALQGRTGILVSGHALGQESGDEGTALQYMRRLETQADCFSGMFVHSVSLSLGVQQQDVDGILAIYDAIGDDNLSGQRDVVGNHGLGRSREILGKHWHAQQRGREVQHVRRSSQVRAITVRVRLSKARSQPGFRREARWRLPRCLHRGQSAQGRRWWSPKD